MTWVLLSFFKRIVAGNDVIDTETAPAIKFK